ncbi:MAG: OmpA family protein [Polyangiaceae bacterium]|nr:OmpA family protein [Polyangiaceae bacterium]
MTKARSITLALALGVTTIGSAGCKKDDPPPETPTATATPVQTTPPPQTGDAVIEGDRIKIARPIFYDTDKDIIRPESFSVIDAIANVVNSHPEIKTLIVEGHTDSQGNFDHNKQLSEKRANAVVMALVARGVKTPTQIAGYGATAPMCATPDDACLQLNRRVEFRIVRQ